HSRVDEGHPRSGPHVTERELEGRFFRSFPLHQFKHRGPADLGYATLAEYDVVGELVEFLEFHQLGDYFLVTTVDNGWCSILSYGALHADVEWRSDIVFRLIQVESVQDKRNANYLFGLKGLHWRKHNIGLRSRENLLNAPLVAFGVGIGSSLPLRPEEYVKFLGVCRNCSCQRPALWHYFSCNRFLRLSFLPCCHPSCSHLGCCLYGHLAIQCGHY